MIDKDYVRDNVSPFLKQEDSPFYGLSDDIDALRWDKAFPYQLMILKASQGQAQMVGLPEEAFSSGAVIESSPSETSYSVTPFRFTLPIPPQELSVNMPIASTVEATLSGIVEQHNGSPFRDIVLSGTTGVTPIKNSASPSDITNPILNQIRSSIFPGTQTFNLGTAIQSIRFTRLNVNDGLTTSDDGTDNNKIPAKSTGYYQYRLLQRFIEAYVELKKKDIDINIKGTAYKTRDLRLALCIWKDEAVYLCSGVQFNTKRSSLKPIEYTFTLQLKAWKRIKLDESGPFDFAHVPPARQANAFNRMLGVIREASTTLEQSKDLIQAVIQDPLKRVGELARETGHFLKVTQGMGEMISDLPNTLKNECITIMKETNQWAALRKMFPELEPYPASQFQSDIGRVRRNAIPPRQLTADESLRGNVDATMSKISPDNLKLPRSTRERLQNERNKLKSQTRLDFEQKRDEIRQASNDFANAIGAGDDTFNLTYNSGSNSTTRVPTDAEYGILYSMNDVAIVLDQLASSTSIDPKIPSSLEYMAGLALGAGIAFKVPISKFAVPFPYGHTLEQIAVIYLGNANRWMEIAALNGLRAPYIDEQGFSLSFLVNGDGNKLYVSDKTNLYINQTCWISSINKNRSKRRITNMREVYMGFNEITVDGAPDLDTYLLSAGSVLEAFLPGTVNSQQTLYIPSDKAAPPDYETKSIPGIDELDPLLQVSGIDLLLTQDGDLAITEDGDCRLSYGLQNIVQTVKLALTTPQGALPQHPGYGIDLGIGDNTADVNVKDLAKRISAMFSGDSTFNGVTSINIQKKGSYIEVTLVLDIKGVSQNVPITFTL
jgi:hypothetical protein